MEQPLPYNLAAARISKETADRLMGYVDVRGETECWPWTYSLHPAGYGILAVHEDGKPGPKRLAHRKVYELLVGPIPDGRTIGHVCHDNDPDCPGGVCPHRLCCNPAHLEPQTRAENVLAGKGPSAVNGRKTHCSKCGRMLAGDNLSISRRKDTKRGISRSCKACNNARLRRYRAERPERFREYSLTDRTNNAARIKESKRKSHAKNRDRINAARRQDRKDNPEKYREYEQRRKHGE